MAETLLFNALRDAIDEEMALNPYVCVMGEDVGQYGGLLQSYKRSILEIWRIKGS